ncbi:unnamed protein product, partial [marine sediment metagenome]
AHMRVTYKCGLLAFSEAICLDHSGDIRYKAKHWVNYRWLGKAEEKPKNVADLVKKTEQLLVPKSIHVDSSGKYTNILDSRF